MAVDENQRAVARTRTQAVNCRRVAAGAIETLEAAGATAALTYGTGARAAEAGHGGPNPQNLRERRRAARFDLLATDGDQIRADWRSAADARASHHDFFQRGLVGRSRLLLARTDDGKSCQDA